jgi:ribosomal protein S18 acetylase RimI-like enzyme
MGGMTVMINPISRIRAIRLREDLRQIADLIELCFSQNIDAEGLDYIRHIRQTANNFSGLILDNTTPENSSLPFHGYVWVESDQIIGNVTLIPLRAKEKGSYFVANVAVHPNYRGRGIGKQLTERAIRHVREHQGKQVYLQVREDNEIAIQIYRNLNFDEISRRTMWIYRPNSQFVKDVPSSLTVTSRDKEDWPQQKVWLESLYPREIHWNIPIRLEKMKPTFSNWITRLMYAEFQRSWSVRKDTKLIGAVTLDHGSETHDYCWLATSPIWEDEVIRAVFPVIEHKVLFPKRLAVNYPAGRARAAFEAVGMHELNTLLWMKHKILPYTESLIA